MNQQPDTPMLQVISYYWEIQEMEVWESELYTFCLTVKEEEAADASAIKETG